MLIKDGTDKTGRFVRAAQQDRAESDRLAMLVAEEGPGILAPAVAAPEVV